MDTPIFCPSVAVLVSEHQPRSGPAEAEDLFGTPICLGIPDSISVVVHDTEPVRLHFHAACPVCIPVADDQRNPRRAKRKLQLYSLTSFGEVHSVAIHAEEPEASGEHPVRPRSNLLARLRARPAAEKVMARAGFDHTVRCNIQLSATGVAYVRRIADQRRARHHRAPRRWPRGEGALA